MTDTQIFGYSDGDIDANPSSAVSLNDLVAQHYSRRQTLIGGARAAALAVFGGVVAAACSSNGDNEMEPANVAPAANAGSDGTATAGATVTLTGAASDSDGSVASVSWTQVSGLSVTIQNAGSNTASFVAPAVTGDTPLVFRFTATDSDGATASDETTITVSPAALGFAAVAKNKNDIVTVPDGYSVTVLYRLGDPIDNSTALYSNDGTQGNFNARAGDHHDAIYYFGLAASGNAPQYENSTRGLLVMNHENITQPYLHPNGATVDSQGRRPRAQVIKEMEAHGLSVVEAVNGAGGWSYVRNSPLNRRITPLTPVVFNGPVAGTQLIRTLHSPDGTAGRGTINNCANGFTPWGTDLTCEENWAFYFKRPAAVDNPKRNARQVTALTRYGVTSSTGNYGWTTVLPETAGDTRFARWDAQVIGATATDDFRNEPNQFGWVVEIDPYDPASAPRKRTALGRFAHEGAWPSNFVEGVRPAFYMGDDSRREYLYKFVSATPWNPADTAAMDRLAIGDKYLDRGTLYVARFDADGTGDWLALVFGMNGLDASNTVYPFGGQPDVLTHARLAADAVGATPMDRPEWTAVNPVNGEMYLTLTNNSASLRPITDTDEANPRHYSDPKAGAPNFGNPNGHILRLAEQGASSEATQFSWDIYAFGADSELSEANVNLSGLDETNDFSSPDGLWFSRPSNLGGQARPLLWVQTDDSAFTDVTNNQMLVAMPGEVGDGERVTITNMAADGTTAQQQTIVGAQPGDLLRRFLVGPIECEITGIDSNPDGTAIFVNIQHPGENGTPAAPTSNWPASQTGGGAGSRPRSATIVITRNDGGVVGF